MDQIGGKAGIGTGSLPPPRPSSTLLGHAGLPDRFLHLGSLILIEGRVINGIPFRCHPRCRRDGYSLLMEAAEASTVATMKSHRRELWTPIPVASHLGLVVTGEKR